MHYFSNLFHKVLYMFQTGPLSIIRSISILYTSSSSPFGTTTLCVFSPSQPGLSKFLSLAVSFQFFIFSFFKSSRTSSCHHCLGLPTGLVPIGFQSNSFLVGLAWSILCIWPSHLILCGLVNLTIYAPSINLSISMLFHILHILSILTGPNIFLDICLSKMRRLFSSFAVNVQVSDKYERLVLLSFYIFSFWCFSLGISILLVLH